MTIQELSLGFTLVQKNSGKYYLNIRSTKSPPDYYPIDLQGILVPNSNKFTCWIKKPTFWESLVPIDTEYEFELKGFSFSDHCKDLEVVIAEGITPLIQLIFNEGSATPKEGTVRTGQSESDGDSRFCGPPPSSIPWYRRFLGFNA